MSEPTFPGNANSKTGPTDLSVDIETLMARVAASIKAARASQHEAEEQVAADIKAVVSRLKSRA